MLSRVVLLYQICLEMTINLFFPLNNTGSSISVLLFLLLFQNRTLKCFDYLQCTILHAKITSCQCFKSCPNWRLHTSDRDSYICKEKLLYYCPAHNLENSRFIFSCDACWLFSISDKRGTPGFGHWKFMAGSYYLLQLWLILLLKLVWNEGFNIVFSFQ